VRDRTGPNPTGSESAEAGRRGERCGDSGGLLLLRPAPATVTGALVSSKGLAIRAGCGDCCASGIGCGGDGGGGADRHDAADEVSSGVRAAAGAEPTDAGAGVPMSDGAAGLPDNRISALGGASTASQASI
jgi:hypothetical protein